MGFGAASVPLFGLLAIELEEALSLHRPVEHVQRSTAGVDLVVMGEIGKAFENAEQLLVPETAQDLQFAGPALRAERSEP